MKAIEEIFQELALEFQNQTGLVAGGSSELSVRFYAVAAQLYSLYIQADWTRRQCFPQTADGEYLDRHAQLRGISRRQATRAAGVVRFYADEGRLKDTAIPAGTVCMTAGGLRYLTTEDGIVATGEQYVDIPVEAVEAGANGNVAAGTVVYMALAPTGITACINPDAISNGQDQEDDDSLRARVLDTYRRLANGANNAFYYQSAMSFDGVAAVTVLPRNRGVGTVDLVIAAPSGMPDEDLIEQVQAYFYSVREIAVDVQVSAPSERTVDVAVTLTAVDGEAFDTVSQRVRQTIENWFTGERLGKPVLRAELTALLFAVEGVSNCVVTAPAADVAADSTALPVLGRLTLTAG